MGNLFYYICNDCSCLECNIHKSSFEFRPSMVDEIFLYIQVMTGCQTCPQHPKNGGTDILGLQQFY